MSDDTILARPARDLAASLRSGALTSIALAEACLAHIGDRESEVRAFAHLDAESVRRQAAAADERRAAGALLGPLHGLPVAVKDIIDTADLPTEHGTPIHRGRRPATDAAIVAGLRAAGAVVLGKTVTSELALYTPGPTRNPHDLARTPGGSSSGSAAAVAAGMAPLALATQTNGSTIRPASFCGIVGYKPSLGLLPRRGILEQSPRLDQPGVMARDVGDAALIAEALAIHDPGDPMSRPGPAPRLVEAAASPPAAPRFAYVRGPYWSRADQDARDALDRFAAALGARPVDLPAPFDRAAEVQGVIMGADIGRALRADWERGRDLMSDTVRGIIERGMAIEKSAYDAAVAERARLIAMLPRILDGVDAIVTPAAPGAAPLVADGTGDPIFATTWTLLGAPAITLPLLEARNGMPLGVQVVAAPGEDARLLAVAAWLEARGTEISD